MNRKFSVFIVAIFIVLGVGIYLFQKGENNSQTTEDVIEQPKEVQQTKEEAIKQAQEYRPEGICTAVNVPAVHVATGATYTFPSGCLAPGWEPVQ